MSYQSSPKPKVAILFSGLLRSIQYTLPNMQENLFKQLTAAGYDYDIYCHNYIFPPGQTYNNPRTQEYNITLNPNIIQHMTKIARYYIEDDQIQTANKLNLPAYRSKGDPWPKSNFASLDNYLLAMYSRKKVTELLVSKQLQEPLTHTYDFVIFARSDVMYEKPLPITALFSLLTQTQSPETLQQPNQAPEYCLIPNFQHFRGLNDRMLICKPQLACKYGLAFDLLLELSNSHLLHSESINKYLLTEEYKVTPILVPVFFSRVRSNGGIKRELFKP